MLSLIISVQNIQCKVLVFISTISFEVNIN